MPYRGSKSRTHIKGFGDLRSAIELCPFGETLLFISANGRLVKMLRAKPLVRVFDKLLFQRVDVPDAHQFHTRRRVDLPR